MKLKSIRNISISFVLVMVLVAISYWNVRNKAENIFHPFVETELYYYGTQFQPFTLYYEGEKIVKWYGPNWYVSYDFQSLMTSGPLSIRYNILGKVIDTNPMNLLDEIIPKKLKEKYSNKTLHWKHFPLHSKVSCEFLVISETMK